MNFPLAIFGVNGFDPTNPPAPYVPQDIPIPAPREYTPQEVQQRLIAAGQSMRARWNKGVLEGHPDIVEMSKLYGTNPTDAQLGEIYFRALGGENFNSASKPAFPVASNSAMNLAASSGLSWGAQGTGELTQDGKIIRGLVIVAGAGLLIGWLLWKK